MMDNIFGERLRELREKNDMYQQDLGNKLDVSKSMIGMYERGVRKPSHKVLQKAADVFHVSSDYLMGFTDVPDPMQEIKKQNDLELFLEQNSVMFKGKQLSDIEKQRINDVLTALFFETYNK